MIKVNSAYSRRIRLSLLPIVLLFATLSVVRAQSAAPLTSPSAQTLIAPSGDVPITAGDILTITVFDTPEFSGPARVNDDGTIDVPLIGRIHVAGLSASSAADLIREQLIRRDFLKDPQVSVNFQDFTNHSALVLGEVVRPGPIPITGIRTLWELIGVAGGVTPIAGSKVTIVRKGTSSPPATFHVDWSRDLIGQPNPVINSGDTIQVSRTGIVYVLGEVNQQGGYPIAHQHMTVSEVIALAQGIKYTSKASHARLVRSTSSSRVISGINVPDIIKGKIPDVVLQDNDVIYVPNSAAKVAILRGLLAAISITSSLVVYKNQ